MSGKLKISFGENVYSINATLVADRKAKLEAKGAMDPMVLAYSIVYGEIFDEAMHNHSILVNWMKTKINWGDIFESVQVEKGSLVKELALENAQVEFVA